MEKSRPGTIFTLPDVNLSILRTFENLSPELESCFSTGEHQSCLRPSSSFSSEDVVLHPSPVIPDLSEHRFAPCVSSEFRVSSGDQVDEPKIGSLREEEVITWLCEKESCPYGCAYGADSVIKKGGLYPVFWFGGAFAPPVAVGNVQIWIIGVHKSSGYPAKLIGAKPSQVPAKSGEFLRYDKMPSFSA
ncbi:hypothetical protein R1flu_005443 [Riccia fluitans]|uniref:Uncharacterized protein n=1 Tax=Riccia fluitans TaxID=41844 RepID=A0ABD1YT70_9MARC